MGQKEIGGTEIGAVVGGAAGLFLGRGAGRIFAGLAGAAIGGLIGNRIGSMLDEQDQKALAAQSRIALFNHPDNAQINWSSEHSGATATVVPVNTRKEQRTFKVVRDANVAPASNLDMIGAEYVVSGKATVRLAPFADAQVATMLGSGSAVWAVGKVHDQPWIMVAQHGQSIGYVAASTVKRAPAAPKLQTNSTQVAFDLDSTAPVRAPADLDSIEVKDPSVKVDMMVASVTCRDLTTTATAKGQTKTTTQTACRAPDGSWDID